MACSPTVIQTRALLAACVLASGCAAVPAHAASEVANSIARYRVIAEFQRVLADASSAGQTRRRSGSGGGASSPWLALVKS